MSTRKEPQAENELYGGLENKNIALESLYIVYDADGTVPGEVFYLLRKWFGKRHCAACDITHGPKTVKPEWNTLQTTGWLGVNLFNIHRDEMDAKLRSVVDTTLPCVAAQTSDGQYFLLLGPEELESCGGQLSALQEKVMEALHRFGFQVSGTGKYSETSLAATDAVVPVKNGESNF